MRRANLVFGAGRVFLLMLVVMNASAAHGQTTAFTYQGQLRDAGALANGSYDLRFALFDAAAGGAPIGANQTVSAVPVSGGVFTVQLDFGVSAFPGANRFVEIGVRPAGGGSFTTLAPRQQISSSPYAIQTLNAQQLGGVPASQYVKATGDGNVGIGTTTPNAVRLFVDGGPLWTANGWQGSLGLQNAAAIGWGPNSSGTQFGIGQSDGGLYFFRTISPFGANANPALYDMVITDSGSVGIGTTQPQGKLSVQSSGYGLTQTDGPVTVGTYVGAGGGWYGTRTNHPLHFFTNNSSPLMTVDTAGNVGIGTESPGVKLEVRAATDPGLYAQTTNGTGVKADGPSYGVYATSSNGTAVYGRGRAGFAGEFDGKVVVSGPLVVDSPMGNAQLVVYGPTTVHGFLTVDYALEGTDAVCRSNGRLALCSSSLRYKTAIRPFRGGLELINRLRPISFTWKSNGAPDLGLGAEDVAAVEPLLVTHNDKGEIEGVKYDKLSGVFINAFKEQQAQIEALRAANAALNARLQEQMTQEHAQLAQQQREINELRRTWLAGSPSQVDSTRARGVSREALARHKVGQ